MKSCRFTLFSVLLSLATPAPAARPDHPNSDRLILACQNALSLAVRERRWMPVIRAKNPSHVGDVRLIIAHHPNNPGHVVYSIERRLKSLQREPRRSYTLLGDAHLADSVVVLSDEEFHNLLREDHVLGHVEVSFEQHANRVGPYLGGNALKTGDVVARDGRFYVVLDGAEAPRVHSFVDESVATRRYQVVRYDVEPRANSVSTALETLIITEDDDATLLVGSAELKGTFRLAAERVRLEAVVETFTPRPPEPATLRMARVGNFREKR